MPMGTEVLRRDGELNEKTFLPGTVAVRRIKNQVSLPINDMSLPITFVTAGGMRMLAHHHPRSLFNQETAHVHEARAGKRMCFNPAMKQDNEKIEAVTVLSDVADAINHIQGIGAGGILSRD